VRCPVRRLDDWAAIRAHDRGFDGAVRTRGEKGEDVLRGEVACLLLDVPGPCCSSLVKLGHRFDVPGIELTVGCHDHKRMFGSVHKRAR
jgi:hypothetical protein